MTESCRRTDMRRDVRRYSSDLTIQVMQTASCNRNHSAEQRLARWQRMMRTRQYLGFMLGLRRAAISEAAGLLQRRKLIRYARGSIQIVEDGAGLKAASRACYRAWSDRPASRTA